MQRKNPCAGSTTVAFALALFLLCFTLLTLYLFAKKYWWFPEPITTFGWEIFRYRDTGGRANYSHGNNTMEFLWTLATLVLFVGLGIYAERAWAEVHFRGASPGALQIEVQGQQFKWYFRYPGPDGKFGRLAPHYVKDSEQNFFGLDPNDQAGKDDIVSPVIAVPVNREGELILRSKDVTHSFFVRELRLKQDAVPGMLIPIHFTATKIGTYEIACAEL